MSKRTQERGAAAVEFALILPVLLLLVLGIMEFSRLYNEQISLTNAARSAARVMAISNDQGEAVAAAIDGSPSLNPPITSVSFSPASCTPGGTMTATINYSTPLLTGWFGTSMTLTGEGAMPCGG